MRPHRKPPMTAHLAGLYSTYRLFEWCMAVMMVLIAITLAMHGDTMERAALRTNVDTGFTEANMATFFGSVGAIRVMAPYLDGYINNVRTGPKGAYTRAVCAAAGCLVMGQLTAALIYDAFPAASAPSFAISVFGTLAGFEALTVYVAVLDGVSCKTPLNRMLAEVKRIAGRWKRT
ncbi:hypothetical protein MHIMP23_23310 [Methylobacterium hispanicum]